MNSFMQNSGALLISGIVSIGFIAVCCGMLFMPVQDTTIGNVMFGGLATGFTLVMGYWLGSSSGSRIKDQHIADMSAPKPITVSDPAPSTASDATRNSSSNK